MDALPEGSDVGVVPEEGDEVLELRAGLLLELEGDLQGLVQKDRDLLEVLLEELAGGEGGGADADSARRDGGPVPRDAVLVEGDGDCVAALLELGSGDALGLEVPEDEVVVGAPRGDGAAQVGELGGQGLGVLPDLLGVDLELRGHDLLELGGDSCDLVLVRAALEGGEDGLVNLGLETPRVLAEEDHSGAGTAEGLVRGGGDDVAVLEGAGLLAGGDEAGDVRHVHEEEGAVGVGDLAELGVVPVAGVGRPAADEHGRLEETRVLGQPLVVDEAGVGPNAVGEALEVDRGGRYGLAGPLLLGVGVEAVGEVAAGGQVEPHDAVVRVKEGGVDGEVGGRSGVGLDVDAPLLGVEAVGLEGTGLTQRLDLVHDLVASVVAGARQTLRVLVGQGRPEALHDGAAGEVLGRDEL